jgi:CheY-like chemotaxis protein
MKVVHLGTLVLGLREMLASVLTERIDLAIAVDANVGQVIADPAQIERVILNLALNARDAMPDGGRLDLGVHDAEITAADFIDPSLPPGAYVKLVVRDHGVGMDERTRAHVFEPFFTTKPLGSGTGLGLSSAYGIVKQSGGHVTVESTRGEGSTFHVWLPRISEARAATEVAPRSEPSRAAASPATRATILVVEDDPEVRELVSIVLRNHGHHILAAGDGREALALCEGHTEKIDLLLCDVVMPQLSGPALVDRLIATRPALRVMFMSGHPGDPRDPTTSKAALVADYLEKPFDVDTLVARVRQILDRSDR